MAIIINTENVRCRCDPADRAMLESLAKEDGLSMSDELRMMLRDEYLNRHGKLLAQHEYTRTGRPKKV